MSSPVIRVEHLSKRYFLGGRADGAAGYDTFRDALVRAAKRPFARLRSTNHAAHAKSHDQEFWALRDVSFEVNRGEVLGIIGRNGAGKSTLLKILSRITEPTSGRVAVKGRIASLLEVGTGFHPELSGRENIFLNGVILGMTRAEVKARFDEIVAFAEVEKFLDTPVKHYSSGMYVRLAFAVAAHLDPEILIVDEVLAVGDASFQEKCLSKMDQITRGDGKTILLVSHQLRTVEKIARRAMLLNAGRIEADGTSEEVVRFYQETETPRSSRSGEVDLCDELVLHEMDLSPESPTASAGADFMFKLRATEACRLFDLQLQIKNSSDDRLCLLDCRSAEGPVDLEAGGTLNVQVKVSRLGFNSGTYPVSLCFRTARNFLVKENIVALVVHEDSAPLGLLPYPRVYLGQFALPYTVEAEVWAPSSRQKTMIGRGGSR